MEGGIGPVFLPFIAQSRALALLESLVHTRKEQIPSDYVFLELDIDDSAVRTLSTSETRGLAGK